MKNLLFGITLFVVGSSALADKVVGIADGDTLTLLHDRRPLKIRMANIDAPEKSQAFGQASKKSLSDLCFGKDAMFETQSTDRYGRTVAVVTCAGIEANKAQVQRGMAWVYDRYNKDRSIGALQEQAKRSRKGLWSDAAPVPPWEFRRPTGTLQSTSRGDPSACYVGPRGGRFQVIDGRKRYGC